MNLIKIFSKFIIIIRKSYENFEENKSFFILLENIKEVYFNFWNELLKQYIKIIS